MTTVQKIQTTAYAITKRLQGYHLLKNPKGTSPYEVKMLKSSTKINKQGDLSNTYEQITKLFKNDGTSQETTRSLDVVKYYNAKAHKYSNKKGRVYTNSSPYQFKQLEESELVSNNRPRLLKSDYIELICKNNGNAEHNSKDSFFKILYKNLTNK